MDLVEAKARGFEAVVRHPWERARLSLVDQLIAGTWHFGRATSCSTSGAATRLSSRNWHGAIPTCSSTPWTARFTDELIETHRARLTVPNVSLFAIARRRCRVPKPAALVLLMDVIEHVPDDVAFLGDICGPLVRRTRTRDC